MSPCPERLGRLCIQRNVFQRSLRFRRTFHHRHYRPTDVQDEVFEIHVLPPKPYQFSSAQPGESVQLDHRAEWIGQFFEKCHDFFRRQNIGCFLSFRALANARDWILLRPFPSDRVRIDRAHDVSDLGPAAPR